MKMAFIESTFSMAVVFFILRGIQFIALSSMKEVEETSALVEQKNRMNEILLKKVEKLSGELKDRSVEFHDSSEKLNDGSAHRRPLWKILWAVWTESATYHQH